MRLQVTRHRLALLLTAAALLLLWLPARWLAKRARAGRVERERALLRSDEAFHFLAASQVGYGPQMRKRFTSPLPFGGFRVLREADGRELFHGGAGVSRPGTSAGLAEVWVGDFSALSQPGRYRLEADNGLRSAPFGVDAGVFDGPLRAVQRGFYFQRAFTAIDARHAEGPWTHPSDAARAPPGVEKGWHDAGDYSIYSASLNAALFWLLTAFHDFAATADDTGIPESGNAIPDLADEAIWGAAWLLSVQERSGGFRNSTCLQEYGPYGTNLPDQGPPYVAGDVGTLATARAVGTLAWASRVLRDLDPPLARRALAAARAGVTFLDAQPQTSDGPTCPAYRADGDAGVGKQARMYAAAGMLAATGEARFATDFELNYVEIDADPSYMHLNGLAALLYLRAEKGAGERKAALRERVRLNAARVLAQGERDPFQLSAPDHWGSIGAAMTRVDAFSIQRCREDPAGAAADCEQALENVHHALGRNSLGLCYVSGLAGVTRARQHAFHHWFAALSASPFLPPGMVAGGPNASPEAADISSPAARPIPIWGYFGDPAFPRGPGTPPDARFTDNDSWSTNEVSLDWQASTLYALYFARGMARGTWSTPSQPRRVSP